MKFPCGRVLVLALACGLLPLFPANAESPSEQLATLEKHLDGTSTRLDNGDLSGAQAAYKAFEDGWLIIEDGIRAQSRASYRLIEDAMGDVKYTLEAEPFEARQAMAALQQLRAQTNAFIKGERPPGGESRGAQQRQINIGTLVSHLDRAQEMLDTNNPVGAAAAITAFRQAWPEVEGLVKGKSAKVYVDTENNMAKAYALLTRQPPDLHQARATLARMKTDLQPFAEGEARYGIFDAAIILLREGMEALLVVAALLTFLTKTNNADKKPWIWFGCGLGVAVSIAIALVVNLAFSQTEAGTNRELLEGLTGLVAAAMLVYVGYWLHSKASLSAWRRYIQDKGNTALAKNSLLSLTAIAFLAVFREGAETVLFYVGIAPSIAVTDLAIGLVLGAAGLATIGVLMLVLGVRVPIRPFFLGTSLLLYYLAFKFVGTGIHALQVAGVLSATPADYFPENGFLGLFPTWETTVAQATIVMVSVAFALAVRLRGSSQLNQTGQESTP